MATKHDRPDGFPTDICIFTITKEEKNTLRKSLPIRELKVLLIKRKEFKELKPDYPYQGYWAIPGGMSTRDETIDEAALRKVKTEANVGENVFLEQYKTVYYPGRDPRGWYPTTVYISLVKESELKERKAGDGIQEVALFSLEEIEEMELAFDHKNIILEAYEEVKTKMLNTMIAKEFLENEFTISELLQVIQTVVPEFNVQKPNFIQKMVGSKNREGLLIQAYDVHGNEKFSDKYSQRPARLYRFNINEEPKLSIYNSTFI